MTRINVMNLKIIRDSRRLVLDPSTGRPVKVKSKSIRIPKVKKIGYKIKPRYMKGEKYDKCK